MRVRSPLRMPCWRGDAQRGLLVVHGYVLGGLGSSEALRGSAACADRTWAGCADRACQHTRSLTCADRSGMGRGAAGCSHKTSHVRHRRPSHC